MMTKTFLKADFRDKLVVSFLQFRSMLSMHSNAGLVSVIVR